METPVGREPDKKAHSSSALVATLNSRPGAALITGASAGLGEEYALQLAAQHGATSPGLDLVLVARRSERLASLKLRIEREFGYGAGEGSPRVHALTCDLTQLDQRQELLRVIDDKGLDVQCLINNAGFGSVGRFAELATERELEMVELNIKALVHLTSHFSRSWRAERLRIANLDSVSPVVHPTPKCGQRSVMNIASTAAFQPLPYMSTYAATKAFVVSFGYALALELEEDGVQVLTVCPGPTHTEFHLAAGLAQKIDNLPGMTAAEVVADSLRRLDGRSRLRIVGKRNFALAGLAKLLPFSISAPIAKRLLTRYVGKAAGVTAT